MVSSMIFIAVNSVYKDLQLKGSITQSIIVNWNRNISITFNSDLDNEIEYKPYQR